MFISILLVAILLIVGSINIFFHLPTKQLYAWLIQSFFSNERYTSSAISSNISTTGTPHEETPIFRDEEGPSTACKKEELKRVFATFDKNGDGFITKQELRDSLKNLKLFMTEKEAEEMVVKVDANGDGLIDFDEFGLLCEERVIKSGEEYNNKEEEESDDLKEAFDVFDKDRDGLISVEELGLVLCSLGLNEGKKVEACREMIRKVDDDGDGMVNFDEFKKMMNRGGSLLSVF